MKLLFASDLHGSAQYTRALLDAFEAEKADKCVLLGDLLYHGPRNPLPEGYAPLTVAQMLNGMKEKLICVRGNCDAEVDGLVLEFPYSADYAPIFIDGITIFATHGHVFNEDKLPPLQSGDVLMHGHTHVGAAEDRGGYYFCNPGSVSIPKDGEHSYMIYENGCFTRKNLQGTVLTTLCIKAFA